MTSADGTAVEQRLRIDLHVLAVDAGRVRLQYAVKPEFMHPGKAVPSQLSISFLAPVTRGPGFDEGRVAKKGRST